MAQRISASGTVLSSHLFDAYGAEATPPAAEPFGYKAQWGYYTDRETGLHLLTHRYYDAGAGRFLTRDPIGYAGGINLYAYCEGDPVSLADPSGYAPTLGPADNYTAGVLYGMTAGIGNPLPGADASSPEFGVGYGNGVAITGAAGAAVGLIGAPVVSAPALGAGGAGAGVAVATTTGGGSAVGSAAASNAAAAASSAAAGTAGAGNSGTATSIQEGIYQFTDLLTGIRYVGQSGNIPARLQQHIDAGRLASPNGAAVTQVLGGKFAREVAEQTLIDSYGGIQNLTNMRNPVGLTRIPDAIRLHGYVRPPWR